MPFFRPPSTLRYYLVPAESSPLQGPSADPRADDGRFGQGKWSAVLSGPEHPTCRAPAPTLYKRVSLTEMEAGSRPPALPQYALRLTTLRLSPCGAVCAARAAPCAPCAARRAPRSPLSPSIAPVACCLLPRSPLSQTSLSHHHHATASPASTARSGNGRRR